MDTSRFALIAQQPVNLLDGVLAKQTARLGQGVADDRHSQRRARHDAERAIGQGRHALDVEVLGEDSSEKVVNKINALDRTAHGGGS